MQIIPFVIGSVLALAAGGVGFRSLRRCVTWASATGKVLRLDEAFSRNGEPRFRAAVEFITRDGREISFHSQVATLHRDYRPGTSVRVMYDPGDPEHAEIASFVRLWLLPVTLSAFAAVFIGISLGKL